MIYVYVATRIFTFFGTYLRTFFEHLSCRLAKIPAEDVRAFKASEMCGHVDHALTENFKQSFMITFIPFTADFLLGCCFLLTGAYRLFFAGQTDHYQPYILTWLGFSCLANCAPSFEDMLSLKEHLYSGENKLRKIVLSPMFAVYYASAFLEQYSVTFVLAAVYTFFYPNIVNIFFPLFEKFYEMLQ